MNKHFISIVMPSLNEERHIGACLDSISRLNWPCNLFEVILVDNGSTDRTVEIASLYKIKLDLTIIIKKNVNVSALRNAGVGIARGDIIAFLDADCTVSSSWLAKGAQYFITDSNSIGVAGCSHKIPDSSSWVAKTWYLTIERNRIKGDRMVLPTGNMFVARDSFVQIGGFDETLISNEDYELCLRYRQRGYRIYSDPEIEATHLGIPQGLTDYFNQQLWHGTHVIKVFLRNAANIKQIRDLNPFKVVFLGLYSLISHVWLLLEFSLFCFAIGRPSMLMTSSVAVLLPPVVLGLKVIWKRDWSLLQFIKLSFLFYLYSLARAISTLNYFKFK